MVFMEFAFALVCGFKYDCGDGLTKVLVLKFT